MLDLYARSIPDVVTLPGLGYALALAAGSGVSSLGRAALGAVVAGGALLLFAMLSRGAIGGGDIKLLAVLGATIGWREALAVLALSQLVACVAAVTLLLARRGRAPFPIGALIALFGAAALVGG